MIIMSCVVKFIYMKNYIERHKERFFDELFSLLRIPSVSSLEQHKPDMQACAERLVELLKEAGADASVLELKKYEALVAVSNGKASKIIIPSDVVDMTKANVVFSETSGLGDTTKAAPEEPKKRKPDPCCD